MCKANDGTTGVDMMVVTLSGLEIKGVGQLAPKTTHIKTISVLNNTRITQRSTLEMQQFVSFTFPKSECNIKFLCFNYVSMSKCLRTMNKCFFFFFTTNLNDVTRLNANRFKNGAKFSHLGKGYQ